jgi:hypothetical protein
LHKSLTSRKTKAADRDLMIFEILESAPSSMETNYLDPQVANSLRKKFDVPRGQFAVIPVGKDGGIKLNRQDQTQLEVVFALIDAMPCARKKCGKKVESASPVQPKRMNPAE